MRRIELIGKVMDQLETYYENYFSDFYEGSGTNEDKEKLTQYYAEKIIGLIKD